MSAFGLILARMVTAVNGEICLRVAGGDAHSKLPFGKRRGIYCEGDSSVDVESLDIEDCVGAPSCTRFLWFRPVQFLA